MKHAGQALVVKEDCFHGLVMNIESIWREYSKELQSFLYSRISNKDDVEDVLQEVLIKTHQQLSTLKSRDKLKPWLYQLTRNTVIDFYRKQGKESEINSEVLWHQEEETKQIQNELTGCILPFIRALPDDMANLITAIDIQGRPQKELAEELKVPYSTLKSRVQKSRVALKKLYQSCCHFELDRDGNIADYEEKESKCQRC